MHDRTKRINKAILAAKKRDHHTCQACGAGSLTAVEGAHLLPRNSPQPLFDPANPEHIITLCRKCHQDYDRNKTKSGRHRWLFQVGLVRQASVLLELYGESGCQSSEPMQAEMPERCA